MLMEQIWGPQNVVPVRSGLLYPLPTSAKSEFINAQSESKFKSTAVECDVFESKIEPS